MISFVLSIAVLVLGYVFYGGFVQKIFSPDNRKTPAHTVGDGVDFVPMKRGKAFLIQLLNIAGTGPIFGALMGAVFGPVVFLWIVFGSVLGGAVHDYMTAMMSERNGGASIAELSGKYVGKKTKGIMRVFSVILLVLVGTVFITSPAALLANITQNRISAGFWSAVILIYYLLAALMPIDKIIGRLYPVFGIVLIVMAAAIIGAIIFKGYHIAEVSLKNMHPQGLEIWPFMFVTVACGAVSGFHATQSPLVAKCIQNEYEGKSVFYGAMIAEAIIALIWAAAGSAFYKDTADLNNAISFLGQSGTVYEISKGLLGGIGGILAVIGVVVCPVTTGDTAFRGVRIILAEWTKLDQKKIKNRLLLTVPVLAVAAVLMQTDFDILWRYFSWSNQTLAAISLWCVTAYLIKENKKYSFLVSAIPAAFMSAVCVTYILMAKEGFRLPAAFSYPLGIIAAVLLFLLFVWQSAKTKSRL